MNDDLNELLRPSLNADYPDAASIYSTSTLFLSGFLGGPVASAVVALANARRLQRLSKDWVLAPLAIGLTLAYSYWLAQMGGGKLLQAWLGSAGLRVGSLLTTILFVALAYGLHRNYYRAMAIRGGAPPSGWVIGTIATLLGFAMSFAALWLIRENR